MIPLTRHINQAATSMTVGVIVLNGVAVKDGSATHVEPLNNSRFLKMGQCQVNGVRRKGWQPVFQFLIDFLRCDVNGLCQQQFGDGHSLRGYSQTMGTQKFLRVI
jgi:hypothetical protein